MSLFHVKPFQPNHLASGYTRQLWYVSLIPLFFASTNDCIVRWTQTFGTNLPSFTPNGDANRPILFACEPYCLRTHMDVYEPSNSHRSHTGKSAGLRQVCLSLDITPLLGLTNLYIPILAIYTGTRYACHGTNRNTSRNMTNIVLADDLSVYRHGQYVGGNGEDV